MTNNTPMMTPEFEAEIRDEAARREPTHEGNQLRALLAALDASRAETAAATRRAEVAEARLEHALATAALLRAQRTDGADVFAPMVRAFAAVEALRALGEEVPK